MNDGNQFATRMDLLESSGQVTAQARLLTEDVIAQIEQEFAVRLDEQSGSQLVTHLAMALSRLDRGDPQPRALPSVAAELAQYPREREFSRRVLGECGQRLGRPVPEGEIDYLAMHLCVMSSMRT
jgi:transcriptional antiterminator